MTTNNEKSVFRHIGGVPFFDFHTEIRSSAVHSINSGTDIANAILKKFPMLHPM